MPKLTVPVTAQLDGVLNNLAEQSGLPKAQVVRRALALYNFLEDEKHAGRKLAIADDDDRIVKELVIPDHG